MEFDGGVDVLVRKARRAVGLARTAEAVLLGAGVGLITWAAAVSSGGAPVDPACWGTALAAALLSCASWKIDLRPRQARLARGIDRRLHLGGGFLTAWESERSGRGSDLSRLLCADLRGRLRSAQVVRAALPSSMPFLAAPLLGAAILAAVLDGSERRSDPLQRIAPVLAGVAAELREAHDQGLEELRLGTLGSAPLRALSVAERSARGLAAESAERAPDAAQRRALAAGLDELAQALEELVRQRAGSPGLRERLTRAATLADSARWELAEARAATRPGAGGRPGSLGDPALGRSSASSPARAPARAPGQQAGPEVEPEVGPGGGPDGIARDISSPDLAHAAGDGTISAPDAGGGVPGTPETSAPGTAARKVRAGAVAVGRWWPPRHADLVGRWVEDRRARHAATTGDGSDPDD
ncbi:MAG: hypothetical protein V3T22_01660 [Planctomycetota bacterium]